QSKSDNSVLVSKPERVNQSRGSAASDQQALGWPLVVLKNLSVAKARDLCSIDPGVCVTWCSRHSSCLPIVLHSSDRCTRFPKCRLSRLRSNGPLPVFLQRTGPGRKLLHP